MKNHIILCAFGTTSRARETYQRFEKQLAPRFPDCLIHWAFSSPTVRRAATGKPSLSIAETAASLRSPDKIVVQSLHLLPGYEFHRTVMETRKLNVPAAIGRPLLDQPHDFVRTAEALKNVFQRSGHDAALVLGHGTDHPCRYLLLQLEKELRRQIGDQVFFTTIEKPLVPAGEIVEKIAAAGYKTLFCIPFLMVAGTHFYKDIIGDSAGSWKNRLLLQQIYLDTRDQGIALLDQTVSIFADHIEEAFATFD